MSKKFKKTGRKALSVFLSATTVVWLSGAAMFVPVAQAATLAELQAMLNDIQAQIAALTGGGSSTAVQCTFTRSLFQGATGNDVKCLQQYLNGAGHQVAASGSGSPGNETTYFGGLTRAAVSSWQAANGVSPTAGYFGQLSQAKYNALIAVIPPPPPPPPCSGSSCPPPPPPSTGSGLSVSAGTQPSASLAVQNAINIPYTRVRFTASADGDVTVNSLAVERTGLMNDAALAGVILLDENGLRLGVSKTLNSDHTVSLNEPFVVKAGQTREMTIAGDMAASLASYAGQVGFLALKAVNTSANVNGTLPITGVGHTTNASLSIGSVTLARGPGDPNSTTTKDVGTTGYIFSSVKATAGSAEDVTWTSIRFYQTGSVATGDLANIVAKDVEGNTYQVTVSSDGKYYTAKLGSGILIKKGLSKEVWIQGDIPGGSDRTIAFDVWDLADVVFRGGTYGYDLQGSAGTGWTGSLKPRYQGSQVTIGSGSLIVSKASSVASQNIVSGGTSMVLGAFEFEAKGEPVTFTSWAVTVTSTNSDSGDENMTLTNITVYDQTGKAIAGPQDHTVGAASLTFTDSITVPVGKNTYTFKGNLNSSWENNDTIQLSFTPATAISNGRGDTTNNTVTPSPSSSVAGQTMTIKAGSLTISPHSTFATTTLIANSSGVEVSRILLDATASGDDLKIKSAKLRKNSTAADHLNNLKLFDGTTQLNGTVADPSASAEQDLTFTFDNDLLVAKGTSKILSLKGDISSSATAGSYWKFDVTGGTSNNDWNVRTALDGADVTESLSGSDGKGITVQPSGGYKVAAENVVPVNTEQWAYGGQKMVTMNVLKFSATSEDIALTDLRLQIDVTGSSSSGQYEKIYIYDGVNLVKEAAAFTQTGQANGGTVDVTFDVSGTGAFIIPRNGSKLMTIKADLSLIAVGEPGVVDNFGGGELLGIDWDGGPVAGNTAAKQKGQGKQSGTSVTVETHSDVTGNGVAFFRALPQVSQDTLTTSAVNGEQALIRFKVKALGGEINLNRLTFTVSTSNITGLGVSPTNVNFRLKSVTNSNWVSLATGSTAAYYGGASQVAASDKNYADTSGALLIVRALVNETANYTAGQYVIPKDNEHIFELWATINDDATAGGSLTVTLQGDDARPAAVSLTGASRKTMAKVSLIDREQAQTACNATVVASTGGYVTGMDLSNASTSFIWSDISSEATSSSNTNSCDTADWMNGFKVPGLPQSGISHTKAFN